jgi:gliding motility-associated protein GldM
MAGGKLSARQKMINLMYLVFIAMMAMQMSKEVLKAFGSMETKFAESNVRTTQSNEALLANLLVKAGEKPLEFAVAANNAQLVSTFSDEFYRYIETLKNDLLKAGDYNVDPETGQLDFEKMEKTDILDDLWFSGDRLTKEGAVVMGKIDEYKSNIREVLGADVKYIKALETFENRFSTEPVYNKKAETKQDWLYYNYQGFPAVASLTKLTAMQNDVKVTEASLFNLFLGNTLTEAVTLKNYQAIVLAEKSAFFAGEKFQGKVVLGKYANVTPTKLVVQGKEINIANAIDDTGAATLDFNVGNVGEKTLNGQFTFLEDGKPLEIPIVGNYVVVPKPNEASVAADKMNVVYRGLPNPLTISVPGVSNNDVTVSAAGLVKVGNGKYNLTPKTGSEVIVKVNAKLEGGTQINDSKVFRIKDLPKPIGNIAGISSGSLNKNDITSSKVIAEFRDFPYDLNVRVTGFVVNISGKAPVTVTGQYLSPEAKAAVNSSRKGSMITITDIKTRLEGLTSVSLKEPTPISVKLKN